MSWLESVVLGLVQGLTEFLPVSSSAHLRFTSAFFFGHDAGAAFTAVSQLGTELAVLIYFWPDIKRLVLAWLRGLRDKRERGYDYKLAWYVGLGSLPIGIAGLLFQDLIDGPARNLALNASVLIGFGLVLAAAEKYGRQRRGADQLTLRDGVLMGLGQMLALIPGVSRSGATTSAGLFLGLERAVAVRFSFLLALPAVFASGIYKLKDIGEPALPGQVTSSWGQIALATLIAFGVGYASIAWLLRYVENHTIYVFVWYRVLLGLVVLLAVLGGVVPAT
ncbi:undecaprenyl-diphosphate phosphatase [Actinomycetospora soli]|uniref:undecaprenyl-diphosphate phosphatase n=1 Tax=Actinomycetospora soli TaxID=2893887 RepID=UPI001E350756|nr:undecaprenyl-diphosphate phosphatase [Actinomycetospora soli]MCD2187523.1 undecaprenyl-diphosphate phosphatase [Actinomycetospora soli]